VTWTRTDNTATAKPHRPNNKTADAASNYEPTKTFYTSASDKRNNYVTRKLRFILDSGRRMWFSKTRESQVIATWESRESPQPEMYLTKMLTQRQHRVQTLLPFAIKIIDPARARPVRHNGRRWENNNGSDPTWSILV